MKRHPESAVDLIRLGVSQDDAYRLRQDAMTLHRWYEKECGNEHGGIDRDEKTGKPFWYCAHTGRRTPTRDLETPALARVARVMSKYPDLTYHHQTDPRGAPLFVLRVEDIPEGQSVDSYYSRGVAVCK